MPRRAVALVLPLLVAAAIGLPRAIATQAPAPVTIPFELVNRHVIVKATVNKSRPLSFVLDTGAYAAIVRSDVAKALNLKLTGSVTSRGAGPDHVASWTRLPLWTDAGGSSWNRHRPLPIRSIARSPASRCAPRRPATGRSASASCSRTRLAPRPVSPSAT